MLNNLLNLAKPVQETKFSVHNTNTSYDIALALRSMIAEALIAEKQIIVLCIGTDRSTGDALGPLTGTRLKSLSSHPHIFGTLDDPVHATNLRETLALIQSDFPNPYIIAIDACLGRLESVGCITVGRGAVKPGAAVNKDLPPVGDAYITGIVNVGGFMEHLVLQSTRLNLVIKMAETIAAGVNYGLIMPALGKN